MEKRKPPPRARAGKALGPALDRSHGSSSKAKGNWPELVRIFLGEVPNNTVEGLNNDRTLLSMNVSCNERKEGSNNCPSHFEDKDLDRARFSEKHYLSVEPEVFRVLYQRYADSLKSKPGIDLDRPPLYRIQDIFDDMAKKAEQLGFGDVLSHLGARKLRVVTMCSGTESPLLSLKMLSDSKLIHYRTTFIWKSYS
jgi:hypothetical protein